MRVHKDWAWISAAALLLSIGGCRGHETTASRSAAAYDEAQRKGIPVQGDKGHGGHTEPSGEQRPAGTAASAEHAGHGAAAPAAPRESAAMAGMDHSQMGDGRAAGAPAGHGAHAAPTGQTSRQASPMAGMDHSQMGHDPAGGKPARGGSMAGMDHSKMQSQSKAQDHSGGAHGTGMTMPPPRPEPALATASPGEPAATLRLGPLDEAAPSSRADAARAAAMASEMASGGHGMVHGTYTQTDAGRDNVAPAPGAAHEGHQAAPPKEPSSADPHQSHGPAGSPRPTPPRQNKEHH